MTFDLQPILTGELLELRPLAESDFDALFAVASDPLIWEQHPESTRYQEPVFRSSRFHAYDADRSQVEIGWTFLARSHWGGRYNGEMKRLMLAHAFRFVDRVLFLIGPTNHRSRRAIEKIGGVLVGAGPNERGHESLVYRIDRADLRGEAPRDASMRASRSPG